MIQFKGRVALTFLFFMLSVNFNAHAMNAYAVRENCARAAAQVVQHLHLPIPGTLGEGQNAKPRFFTSHLDIRALNGSDWGDMTRLFGDPRLDDLDLGSHLGSIQRFVANNRDYPSLVWGTDFVYFDRQISNHIAGIAGFKIEEGNPFFFFGSVTNYLGRQIGREEAAREAASAILKTFLAQYQNEWIFSRVSEQNKESQELLKSLGFKEGKLDPRTGQLVYSLERKDFTAQNVFVSWENQPDHNSN